MLQRTRVCSGLLLLVGGLLAATTCVDGASCVMPSVNTLTTDGCRSVCNGLCVQYNNSTKVCGDGKCAPHSSQCSFQEVCIDPQFVISLVDNQIRSVNIAEYWMDVSEVSWYGGPSDSSKDKGKYFNVTFNKNVFSTPGTVRVFHVASVDLVGNKLDDVNMSRRWEDVKFSNANLTAVPIQIEEMTNLTALNLSLNSIGDIDEDFLLPSNLKTLNLYGNSFPEIPKAIYALKNLDELHLDGCEIMDLHLDADQVRFLMNIPKLYADFNVTKCRDGYQLQLMRQFGVCLDKKACMDVFGDSMHCTNESWLRRSWWVLLVVAVAIALLVIIVFIIRRRPRGHGTMSTSKATYEQELSNPLMRSPGEEIYDIWDDAAMRKARIEYDAVKLIKIIAHGSFGQVWLGVFERHNVVVKKMRNDKREPQYLNAFVDEIKMMATLEHPKIVTFIGAAWHSVETLMAVTEYMDGGDLCSFLATRDSKYCTWDQTKGAIASDIAEALVYLHSFNPKIIHRDLKSRNIMLDHDLNAKLTDFGISRQEDLEHTMTCTGTVRWMAPEVVAGERYNEAADVYSFGVVLTELDTHKLPFHDVHNDRGEVMSDMEIVQLVASGAHQPTFSRTCPDSILQLGVRCLAADPKARPTSVQVSYALRQALYVMREEPIIDQRTMLF